MFSYVVGVTNFSSIHINGMSPLPHNNFIAIESMCQMIIIIMKRTFVHGIANVNSIHGYNPKTLTNNIE